ncbi:adhesive plaque matrix protein 2-like isoform X3 [Haliotis rufescens]|uniref:adhesive plaque matrix protein 2-like isoform X3 n=1 Tax=Haliotis rufescens TaxID=6454 RepID=UPI00201E7E67|nr:adhesive plaque matrix protein 2-like isoform X3 [Haliotis rufescens]
MFKFGMMVLLLVVMILAVIRDVKAANCVDDAACGAHGTCPDTSAPCVCTDGYSGDDCTTAPVCTASGNECGSHGSCDTSGRTYSCTCTGGYTGATCTTAPCTSGGSECGTHGTCNTDGTTVKCDCTPGYTGTLCAQQSGGNRVTFLAQLLLIPIVLSRYMQ